MKYTIERSLGGLLFEESFKEFEITSKQFFYYQQKDRGESAHRIIHQTEMMVCQ